MEKTTETLKQASSSDGDLAFCVKSLVIREELGEMLCKFCHNGVVGQCTCGCAGNGAGKYVCSNEKCTGDEFQILGV